MAKIVTIPNPILREKSKKAVVDKKTLDLVKTLKETVKKDREIIGVGLAAIQIGIPKRVFIAYSEASKKFLTFINPEIVWFSKRVVAKKEQKFEGCLSVPGKWALIKRPKEVKVKYQTESGQTQVKKFSGRTATVLQHEFDHLNGVLFIDRALEQKEKIFELKKDEKGEEYLEEITL